MKSKYDLTRFPGVKPLLRARQPQLLLRTVALAGFLFAILAGIFGTPVGSRNFAIVFVWIAWWAMLMLAAVPLFGRLWCSICPIPMPGEWLQQGALLGPQGKGVGLGRKWPKALRSIWLQNIGFTGIALFSVVILTQPGVTAIVLGLFLLIAVAASLIFERRAFCRYICPVGGFIGLYAQMAPLELRVKKTAVCAGHTEKTCYTGKTGGPNAGYGCPWGVFPGGLFKNTYCGLCMECLRTCPHDNLAINLRRMAADLEVARGRRLDEVFKAFIMLGAALVYSAVMLGPWGELKTAAYQVGSLPWLGYALAFVIFIFGVLPGAFYLAVAAGHLLAQPYLPPHPSRKPQAMRRSFTALAYSLVPLGLAAWVAFSLSFVLANISYIWPALSDPLGWGWDLLGLSTVPWTPYLTSLVPVLQVVVLFAGLVFSSRAAGRIARQLSGAGRGSTQAPLVLAFPVILFCLLVTAGLFGLFIA